MAKNERVFTELESLRAEVERLRAIERRAKLHLGYSQIDYDKHKQRGHLLVAATYRDRMWILRVVLGTKTQGDEEYERD